MSELEGTWRNETEMMGAKIVTTQIIRADDTFETRMEYPVPGGGLQTIVHEGALDVEPGTFRVHLKQGRTKLEGAGLASMNFDWRPFTEAEHAQAVGMLDQDFPYTVEGDMLKTSAKTPMGEMEMVYTRVEE